MLITLFLWGFLHSCICFELPGSQPAKPFLGEFQMLSKDMTTGCKVIFFPPSRYHYYGESCIDVPKELDSSCNQVSMRSTKITKLSRGDFDHWDQITSLSLEVNTELRTIEAGVFRNMSKLKNLTIKNNCNLKELSDGVFEGLVSLKALSYTNNMKDLKQFLYSTRPAILPKLEMLDISENFLYSINATDFEHLRNGVLKILSLRFCSLVYVDPRAFSPLYGLTVLDLGNNDLNTTAINDLMIGINETTPNLSSLCLASNLIHKDSYTVLKTISHMNISYLDLSENHFDPMIPGTFPTMSNLVHLDLSGIKAVSFPNGTLTEEIVPNLKKLNLSKNRFISIIEGFLLPNLVHLDLSENTCETCFSTSLFKIHDRQLEKMEALEVLNLSKNNLYYIKKYMFYNLLSLTDLSLSNCSIYKIDNFSFSNLTNLLHLDLSQNNFIISYALTKDVFDGLVNLSWLNLESCGITELSDKDVFFNLKNLIHLNLKRNYLVEFDQIMFSHLTSVEIIDMSHNDILEWETELFYNNKNLKTLSLVSNQIGEVTISMLKDFSSLTFVDLKDNPFFCTCSALSMVKKYMNSVGLTMVDINLMHLNDTKNVCFAPRKWATTEFIDYLNYNLRTGYCDYNMIVIMGITAGILFLTFLIVCTVYYLRWHIRYWAFLLQQSMGHDYFPKKKRNPPDGKYKYDGFVSYSHEDRNFVVKLVTMLESQEPFLSLCVFDRDFDVGGVITENVMTNLASSRRTILVLSDSFARSTWCLWEMQMAQHKWIFFKDEENDPLIIIKIGEIMDRHMTPTLRYLIKTRIYLQWNPDPKKQKIFWQKLRSALSRPTMN
ncbi:toll-like receptor 4 [Cimex lectularius]|uniref:TIR domain-containing protein n=1 Tax=Cimex lectularius TaxID=79782 RepID=A0A8I6R6Y9_CIMLE|nr:toll-like receptor 4 [Cimex lectularius]XP_014239508.1 toll-like receptor 4 [Cimex lectularius]